ncbi:MAG: BadF/BadG/BcrA/BcrD ATPase family protein, partial [Methanomicrobium sp.]|nr:BadF/BadG/BcrA/BcrD ATPase family protein [Methanomicrobium sp.]
MKEEQPVRVAQLSCGPEHSGVQKEIYDAAAMVNAEMFFPDVALADINKAYTEFGLEAKSADLKLAIARAKALVDGSVDADAVFIATCFRCSEAAIVRNELRRYIHNNSTLPVVSYSFTERTTSGTLLTRMEALTTVARRRALLAREKQTGITMGIDSGSSTTKAVVMKDNKIIGLGWTPTTGVIESAETVVNTALEQAGLKLSEVEAIGTTGYGRYLIGDKFKADLIQEELTVNSKGAVYLADK